MSKVSVVVIYIYHKHLANEGITLANTGILSGLFPALLRLYLFVIKKDNSSSGITIYTVGHNIFKNKTKTYLLTHACIYRHKKLKASL